MYMKYKCSVELELQFPESDEKTTETAKAAIEELIDGAIQDSIFREMCGENDKVVVTRELLEYVDDKPEDGKEKDTTYCVCEETEPQDIVSDEA